MRRAFISVAPLVLFFALPLAAHGQDSTTAPTANTSDFLTVSFPAEKEIHIDLKATSRLPDADAKAEVKNEKGTTHIELKLDDMKPAVLFGGDFNTYVLWLITPEGQVQNLGEVLLDGDQAKLKATTPLSNFGMFVTAEPHFLVDFPSRMVVLTMEKPTGGVSDFRTAQLHSEGVKGLYDFTRETLAEAPEIERDDLAFDVAEARTAVRLAERSGAGQFAAVDLQAARQALQRAEEAATTEKKPDNRMSLSREAVRLAVKAQTVAQERLLQAQQEEERERNKEEAAQLRTAIAAARSEAEKARLEAEQQRLQAQLEQQARERAQATAAQAQEQARNAQEQAERAQQINQAEERGRQQGFNEASQAFQQAQESARIAEQRYQELSLEQQRRDQVVLEAERALRQAEQNQQGLQDQQPRTEADSATAQQQVDRARAELEQARHDAQQARQRAQQAEAETQRAKQLAAQRQQELTSERQAHQQTEQQLNQLQTEQARTRAQLRNALSQVAETRETSEGLIVNLPDILFEFDSASLKPQAREVLEKIAQTLGSTGGHLRLRIEGHTDNVGQSAYNRELSQARAQSVSNFLVKSGLDASQVVEVRGMGEDGPRASNDSEEGRQENRRVEILVQEATAPRRAE